MVVGGKREEASSLGACGGLLSRLEVDKEALQVRRLDPGGCIMRLAEALIGGQIGS